MNRYFRTVTLSFLLLAAISLAPAVNGQQRLLAVGGGERSREMLDRFVAWAGGPKADILVITWASGEPEESFAYLKKELAGVSPAAVTNAPIAPIDPEERAKFVTQLASATAVFFTGGDQNRIMDVLADKELLELLRDKYRKGTPFGGTSAGTAVLSDPMMTGEADLKLIDGSQVGTRPGLGLVPGVVFDQHFLVRQRNNRLIGLILKNPQMLGIGIDEDNAVAVEDNRWAEVIGPTHVVFYDGSGQHNAYRAYVLSAGERFDLKKRKPARAAKASGVRAGSQK